MEEERTLYMGQKGYTKVMREEKCVLALSLSIKGALIIFYTQAIVNNYQKAELPSEPQAHFEEHSKKNEKTSSQPKGTVLSSPEGLPTGFV
ncbi:hypothetical protein AVEN_227409-1 [Araneus ventricosus]|uniref:Uncharacterized protein n=1 Tax=Araneus ventricosus TaxID=182803 RepID=A0A4Y2PUC3_ARAVE|nr:hypothetical protein AVEN_227409-1 [Araneus ventricosus]